MSSYQLSHSDTSVLGEEPGVATSEKERLYHALIEATNTGYVLTDSRGFVLDANDEFVRLTGSESQSDVIGHALSDWTALHDLQRIGLELAQCLDSGSIRNLDIDYVTPDGRIVAVEINARTQETAAGTRIIAFCRDITARRRAENERRTFEKRLQETQKLESLGVLAGGIAHDFNNLLTGILGNVTLAHAQVEGTSPLRPLLSQIEAAASRAGDLCQQMLAYAGKGRFLVRRLDLNSVIRETTQLLLGSIAKNAALQCELAEALPPIMADATQMRQIIMNLVINSAEAMADRSGNIVLTTRVVDASADYFSGMHLAPEIPAGEYVSFEVRDTGSGMSPEVQARIFDPFFTTKFTGRGLGLAAVIGIVRGHHGALKVESEEGAGTRFTVLLPVADGVVEAGGGAPSNDERWHSSGKILVIDDEEILRTTTAAMLELFGLSPVCAADGYAGVEAFAESPDDMRLILLDLTMPNLDGLQTLERIRAIRAQAPILLMSGFTEQEVARRFAGHELAGFLQKPFKLSTLREKLAAILCD
jgi:PAS domain S-box-containing protein